MNKIIIKLHIYFKVYCYVYNNQEPHHRGDFQMYMTLLLLK